MVLGEAYGVHRDSKQVQKTLVVYVGVGIMAGHPQTQRATLCGSRCHTFRPPLAVI